jgi:hypothetical protein
MRTKETMLTLFVISVLTILFGVAAVLAHPSNAIIAVYGSTPTIDGFIGAGEWDDASAVTVSFTEGANCTVYAKQDRVNLFIGVSIPDNTFNSSDSCVTLLDPDYDQSDSLQPDDMWLAISRQGHQAEQNVTWQVTDGYGSYGWLSTSVSNWTLKSNSNTSRWQAEYNITYSKIGVQAGTNKSLGLAFAIIDKDVPSGWYMWPCEASITKPSTWGELASNGYNWVPEFSTWTSLLLLLIVLTVAITICRRRLIGTSFH